MCPSDFVDSQPRPSSAAAFGGRSRRHPIPRSHGSDRQDIGEEAGGRRRRRGDGAVRALFGVVFLPGRPEDPCRVSLTCRTLGNGQDVYRGLCLVEDAARRPFEQSSAEWERSRLPEVTTARDGSSFAATLPMIRSRLAFDRPVGNYIRHGDDESPVFHSAFCLIWTGGPCQFMRMDED